VALTEAADVAGWDGSAPRVIGTFSGMLRSPGPSTVAAFAAVLVLAACGDDEPPAAEPPPIVEVVPDDTDGSEPDEPDEGDQDIEAADPDAEPPADAPEPEPEPEPDLSVALQLTEVASLSPPTAGAVGPDGTLFVATRLGTVHPLTDDGVGDAVVDISSTTTTDGERGLLGLAFAADGTELYLSSTDRNGDTVISGVPVTDGTPGGDVRTIYGLEQPFSNHNGGNIAVGPDGMLYLGLGDGGRAGDPLEAGQDLTTTLGAMLRIDPQGGDPYAVPADNPFLDTAGAAPEIVAYGLRNPWRFSFDRATGELWIADVGQDTREEINRVTLEQLKGANFGWNLMEGTLEFVGSEPDDHVPPVYEYDTRGPEGCSVTGGYVYRGEAIPELTGAYLYADVCNGTIRGLLVDADGAVVEQAELGIDGGSVVSFAEDADGELYVFDLDGRILRIDPA
jgi:glucose/arabinose dehydrogenase